MSVTPSRPLATKASGARQPVAVRAREIAALEFQQDPAVGRAFEHGHRRQIHARPGVHEILIVRREDRAVIPVGVGQRRQARAVEVYAVVLDEIRVLFRIDPAGHERNLACGLVHANHAADHPVALRDLVLHEAGGAVEHVEVGPPVALGHPDDVLAVIEIVAIGAAARGQFAGHARIVNEGVGGFVDDRACDAGLAVHFDHAIELMAALVVFEGDAPAVAPPEDARDLVGIRKERVVDENFTLPGYIDQDAFLLVEGIAGLGVETLECLRLHLVGRRGIHVSDHPAIAVLDQACREDLGRVWRPLQTVHGEGPLGRAAMREDFARLRRCCCRTHAHVVVFDRGDEPGVGGRSRRSACAAAAPLLTAEGATTTGSRAATRTRAACAPAAGWRRRTTPRARVRRQRARPRGVGIGKVQRLVVVRQRECRERQRRRGECFRHRGAERHGKPLMIERGPFRCRGGINELEGVPALDGLPVPEFAGRHPYRRVGNVHGLSCVFRLQAERARVVGKRHS